MRALYCTFLVDCSTLKNKPVVEDVLTTEKYLQHHLPFNPSCRDIMTLGKRYNLHLKDCHLDWGL